MPLDENTRRFELLMQRELRRLATREEERAARGEEVTYDSVSRLATCETRGGAVAGRFYGERLATYATRDRILRWGWAGGSTASATTHAEVVFREGQARGIPQLTMSVVGDLELEEATALARLAAVLARAEALLARSEGPEVQFFGLFDRPRPASSLPDLAAEAHFSVPPPPVGAPAHDTPPPAAPYRSLPPLREVDEPRSPSSPPPGAGAQVREPSRAVFLPAATAALTALARAVPGYTQALFVVTVDHDAPARRRLIVQLVALDVGGLLRALDPPRALVDLASAMVEADRASGKAPWRKLSARIKPKPDGGATLHVDLL
jgi:hypothetical protein